MSLVDRILALEARRIASEARRIALGARASGLEARRSALEARLEERSKDGRARARQTSWWKAAGPRPAPQAAPRHAEGQDNRRDSVAVVLCRR